MAELKKTIHTLDIEYPREITEITFPYLAKYAEKIGASINVVRERKFPNLPVVFEKFQLFELGKTSDWNIFVDADVLVHTDTFDVTEYLDKGTSLFYSTDISGVRFSPSEYTRRDQRGIAAGSWFVVWSDICSDLWCLPEVPLAEILENITPMAHEVVAGRTPESLIDDYVLTQNIARFGLKIETFVNLVRKLSTGLHGGFNPAHFFWHEHCMSNEQKVMNLRRMQNA